MIELVMVIVILGVLAAVALPRFVDLKDDAQTSATQGVAGAIATASAINFASRNVNSSKGIAIVRCSDASQLLQGGLPTGYTIGSPLLPLAITNGATVSCPVNGPVLNNGVTSSASAQVTGIL